jgi:hypothetical protein
MALSATGHRLCVDGVSDIVYGGYFFKICRYIIYFLNMYMYAICFD